MTNVWARLSHLSSAARELDGFFMKTEEKEGVTCYNGRLRLRLTHRGNEGRSIS